MANKGLGSDTVVVNGIDKRIHVREVRPSLTDQESSYGAIGVAQTEQHRVGQALTRVLVRRVKVTFDLGLNITELARGTGFQAEARGPGGGIKLPAALAISGFIKRLGSNVTGPVVVIDIAVAAFCIVGRVGLDITVNT